MNLKLKEKTRESVSAVLPIVGIVLVISIFLVPIGLGTMVMFLAGAVMLIFGMGFFQLGAEISMTPLGEGIGSKVSKKRRINVILAIIFIMGVIITISEPDLQVMAQQVPSVPNSVLIIVVAAGVGIFLVLAVLRIFLQISLSTMLMILYIGLIIFSFFVPKDFIAVAFDSGGVTTGPMTVPFIMAMGIGLASARGDKNAVDDSFGLVALSGIGPVLAVLLLGCFYRPTGAEYSIASIAEVITTRDVALVFFGGLPAYLKEVMISLLPIAAVFMIFQIGSQYFKWRHVKRIIVGFLYTYIGLVLFLWGANIGFTPAGALLGSELASLDTEWMLVPIGMLIGYFIVKAEPAIQVLNRQVASVTNGTISINAMDRCLSIGVSVSVGLALLRVLTGIPIQWIIIPGYIAALILSKVVSKMFVGIAFDSGGVASGPMTTTFLLPLSIGVCEAVGGNILTDAFGVVALVALTPLIAVQIMGAVYRIKMRRLERDVKQEQMSDAEINAIYEFEEEKDDE